MQSKKALRVLCPILIFVAAFSSSSAQQVLRPEFVADINPLTQSSDPREYTEYKGDIYFVAQTNEYDNMSLALWRLRDGVAEMLFPEDPADLADGSSYVTCCLKVFGDELLFAARLPGEWGLISFDGSNFTEMRERFPQLPPVAFYNSDDAPTVWNDELLIHEDDSLWVYDGVNVENRGRLVLTSSPQCPDVRCTAMRAVEFAGALYFPSRFSVSGSRRFLTKYDGQDLVHVDAYDSTFTGYPQNLTVYNGMLYFSAEKGSGRELYRFDGTSIELAHDIVPGVGSSSPRDLFVFNDELLFTAVGASGYYNLWRLKASGTLSNLGLSFDYSRGLPDFTPLGSELYFFAGSFRDTGWELYSYNGSTASVVEDVVQGYQAHVDIGSRLTLFDGNLYWRGWDPTKGSGLFRFDGATRHLVVNTYWVPETSQATSAGLFTSLRHEVFGSEPHIIESGGGPPKLGDDVNTTPLDSGARSMVKHGRLIYFAGGNYLFNLYQFLPLTKNVELVDDGSLTNVDLLTVVGDKLYFGAEDGENGLALRVLDASGMNIINTSKDGSSFAGQFAVLGGSLYYTGVNGFPSATHLWKHSNGEPTFVNDDDMTFAGGERMFYVFDGALYYRRWGDENNIELRRHDEQTTATIGQITTDYFKSIPAAEILGFGDRIFFPAFNEESGTELWAFADTTSSLVTDLVPGAGSSQPSDFVVHGDTLYFFATTPETGRELFLLDGESARLVGDVFPGSEGSNPADLVSFDGGLYWAAEDSVRGRQMWRYSDGSIEVLTEVFTEPIGSDPGMLTVIDNELYFFAYDEVHGRELWRLSKSGTSSIDDTPSENHPTLSLSDPYPNPSSGRVTVDLVVDHPAAITLKIFDVLGRELMSVVPGQLVARHANPVSVDTGRLPAGTYFIRVDQAGRKSEVVSFVVGR